MWRERDSAWQSSQAPWTNADFDSALPPLPPGGPAPTPREHARRMLARAVRAREVNEQGLRRAARRNRWPEAERHAGRAMAAERAVLRWQAAVQRLPYSNGSPYRFDTDQFDQDDDSFVRVLRVLSAPRAAGQPRLRTAGRIGGRGLLRQLWNTHQGIFLGGASEAQARQWAQREAHRVGGTVVHDPPHLDDGRPHFHIERPGGERSGHIFYGAVPRGTFFESAD
jgi:hypothetical protein